MEPAIDTSLRVIENMSSKEINKIEQRMYPGKWSQAGFLTKNQHLRDLIQQDADALKVNNITYDQIADYLDTLIGKSVHLTFREPHSYAQRICISKIYIVSIIGFLGYQTCPFTTDKKKDCGESKGSMDIRVRRVDTQEELSFPSLLPHLVRAHHFFEGGSYRADPTALIRFFDLKPGVDYKMKTKATISWFSIQSGNGIDTSIRDRFKKEYLRWQVFNDENVQAFFFPNPSKKIFFNDRECSFSSKDIYLFVFSADFHDKFFFSFKNGQEVISFEDHLFPNSYSIYRMEKDSCPIFSEDDGYLDTKDRFTKPH